MTVTSDGGWLATASLDGTLRIWDAASWKTVAVMRVDDSLGHCQWTPDGQSLAAAGTRVYVFDFRR
jgi:WD40 repeat protein